MELRVRGVGLSQFGAALVEESAAAAAAVEEDSSCRCGWVTLLFVVLLALVPAGGLRSLPAEDDELAE